MASEVSRTSPSVLDAATAPAVPLIRSLNGVRGIAAVWIAVVHFQNFTIGVGNTTGPVSRFIVGGYYGVDLFFILSGFVVTYNYLERFRRPDLVTYRRFLEARFARLYPVYFVMLFFYLGIVLLGKIAGKIDYVAKYDVGSFIQSLFVVRGLIGVQWWNPPSWSVSFELLAYLFSRCSPI